MSDFTNAIVFIRAGIMDVLDWCQDDDGVIQDMQVDRQNSKLAMIG